MDWKHTFSLGVPVVDAEHQAFLQLISNIEAAVDLKVEAPLLRVAIGRLRQFAVEHFNSEEAMMRAHRYDKLAKHEKAHLHFLKRLDELDHHLQHDLSGQLQMLNYIRDWFVSHLENDDREYARFALNAG